MYVGGVMVCEFAGLGIVELFGKDRERRFRLNLIIWPFKPNFMLWFRLNLMLGRRDDEYFRRWRQRHWGEQSADHSKPVIET